MKKFFILASAVFAVLACAKEKNTETVVAPVMHQMTIQATAGDIVKTAYANETSFSWSAGDKIAVLATKGSETRFFPFETSASGASVEFSGEVEDGFTLGAYAVYPVSLNPSISGNALHLTLPSEYASLSDISALPLVGTVSGENTYAFKTAVGILKITLDNLWAEAAAVQVGSANEPIAGEFALTSSATAIPFDAAVAGVETIKVGITPDASRRASFYLPVPEGSITALEINVLDKENKILGTKTSSTGVSSVRNKVLPLTALPMRTWHIETVAGNGTQGMADGIGTAATVNIPQDFALAPDGTYWFTVRGGTFGIRSYNPQTHEVKSITMGQAPLAGAFPWGCAFGPDGNLYVACKGSNATNKYLAKVDYSTKTPSQYTPEGFPTITATNQLMSITFDQNGTCYVNDRYNLTKSYIYVIKDDKLVKSYEVPNIESLELDYAQKNLILGGNNNWLLRMFSLSGETASVIAGSGTKPAAANYSDGDAGDPKKATVGMIEAICQDSRGNIYFGDLTANTLRMLSPGKDGYTDGTLRTIVGQPFSAGSVDGEGNGAKVQSITGIIRVTDDSYLILCGASSNRIRKVWLE